MLILPKSSLKFTTHSQQNHLSRQIDTKPRIAPHSYNSYCIVCTLVVWWYDTSNFVPDKLQPTCPINWKKGD